MGVYKYPLLVRDTMFLKSDFSFIFSSSYNKLWYDVDEFQQLHKYDVNLIFNV